MKPVRKAASKQARENSVCARQTGHQTSPTSTRRGMLMASGFAILSLGSRRSTPAHAGQNAVESILQPSTPDDTTFIQRAFEMRQMAIDYGDQAYGALIVRDNIIVGQSWSRVILDQDPTAHAEMSAIRDTARRLNSRDLSDAVMYSSSRPCPMCEAAAYWAGIGQLIHGRGVSRAGSPKLCR